MITYILLLLSTCDIIWSKPVTTSWHTNAHDGQSIVNLFQSGYAYQVKRNDGSMSQVIYVSGPQSKAVGDILNTVREENKNEIQTPLSVTNGNSVPTTTGIGRAFEFVTSYLTRSFNAVMNFLGLPTLSLGTENVTVRANIDPPTTSLPAVISTPVVVTNAPTTTTVAIMPEEITHNEIINENMIIPEHTTMNVDDIITTTVASN